MKRTSAGVYEPSDPSMPRPGSGPDHGNLSITVPSKDTPQRHSPYNGNGGSVDDDHSDSLPSPAPQELSLSHRTRSEGKLFSPISLDKSNFSAAKLSKRESLKVQKRNYRSQKKQAAKELLCTLKDPSVIVIADWLKVRGTLKSWTKIWCVLKPGLLILYRSQKQKSSHWVGTVLLNTCRLIERPSKKGGFCFKLFHPLDQSIWATKGPKGETIGAMIQPLPYSYLIFRAPSESAGKCWMDALELALRCTSLLMKSMTKDHDTSLDLTSGELSDTYLSPVYHNGSHDNLNESDCERHFANHGLDEDYKTDREENKSDSESSQSDYEGEKLFNNNALPVETEFIEDRVEELGQQGDACQTEEVNDENKSLIWTLVKQVRPGMDLSKVVLPTFILETRSFLDKLSDYYYHADFLSEAVLQENPYLRLQNVARWYLSGFYKKPKGLKKPYNPIIGEVFRCYWRHPKTNSRTFYLSEQISHHPPISAFYVSNRQDGFNISGSILAKSKFYGNSLSALLDGTAKLTFLKRGEDYFITMPYAHCKGILIGTLTMEFGGKISINCPKTGYRCEMEFKLKPFLGSGEASNRIVGKFKIGSETLATLDGHWDQEIFITDRVTGDCQTFWNPVPEVKAARLRRYTVPIEVQGDMESERLWRNVSKAVQAGDMNTATEEKFILEDRQRREAKERKVKMIDWNASQFEQDLLTGEWIYKYSDMRPWDPSNDLLQYECDFIIQTRTRHKTPVVRTRSITSLEQKPDGKVFPSASRHSLIVKRPSNRLRIRGEESGSSTPELDIRHDSDSSESAEVRMRNSSITSDLSEESIQKLVEPLIRNNHQMSCMLQTIQQQLRMIQMQQRDNTHGFMSQNRDWLVIGIILTFQAILYWIFK